MTNFPRKYTLALMIVAGAILPPACILLFKLIDPGLDPSQFYRPSEVDTLPRVEYSFFEQSLICFVAFGIKQAYEIITLVLIIKLRRYTATEAVITRWGLTAFLLGELSCAFNYLLFNENSLIIEYLHVFGMLVCFSFIFYALLYILDTRILKYSNKESKCTLLFFCKYCYKNHPVPCTAVKIYQMLIPAIFLLCLMPVSGEFGSYFVVADVFGDPVVFGHSLAQQIMEAFLFPGIAAIFFLISLIVFVKKKENGFKTAKVFLAAGMGALFFSLFRFALFHSFKSQPNRADIWEELTEFIFIACIFYIVRLASRDRLPIKYK